MDLDERKVPKREPYGQLSLDRLDESVRVPGIWTLVVAVLEDYVLVRRPSANDRLPRPTVRSRRRESPQGARPAQDRAWQPLEQALARA